MAVANFSGACPPSGPLPGPRGQSSRIALIPTPIGPRRAQAARAVAVQASSSQLVTAQVVADYVGTTEIAMVEGGAGGVAAAVAEQGARQRSWLKRCRGFSGVKNRDLRPRKRCRRSCLQWTLSLHNQAALLQRGGGGAPGATG